MFIGVGRRGSPRRHRHSQTLQLAFATGPSAASLAQRVRASPLAILQRHELAPTRKTPRVAPGLMLLGRLLEFPARKRLQYSRRDAEYFHWVESLAVESVLRRTQSSASGRSPHPQPPLGDPPGSRFPNLDSSAVKSLHPQVLPHRQIRAIYGLQRYIKPAE